MVWRKWIVRGLAFVGLGGLTLLGLAYQYLTNPESIRRQVLNRLQADLVGINASLDSAKLHLFGGIAVRELRLSRRDDLDKSDFLYVPFATLYHDKEHLLKGKLSIRKVEIQRPRLRAVRYRDGHWNLSGLFGPSDLSQPLPTVVVRQGTLVVEDRLAASGTPPLEIKDLHLTLINDPLPYLSFDGGGSSDVIGPVRIHGRASRSGGGLALTVDVPAMAIGPDLVEWLAAFRPEAAVDLRGLSGKGELHATLTWNPLADPALTYSAEGKFTEGKFSHARLPRMLEHLNGSFHCGDGTITRASLNATAGPVLLALTLKNLDLGQAALGPWTEAVERADLTVQHLRLNNELFKFLPAETQALQKEYSPAGKMSVGLSFVSLGHGRWRKCWDLRAEDMTAYPAIFRYPVSQIQGAITLTTQAPAADSTPAHAASPGITGKAGAEAGVERVLTIDLKGMAGGQPVYLKGDVKGDETPIIALDLWGNDLPVDERLLSALPKATRKAVGAFHPTGQIDFRVFLRRPRGAPGLDNRTLVHLHRGTVRYDVFPLPLRDVSVTLDVRPDHWEFHEFVGHHNGGVIRASGGSHPMPAQPPATTVRTTTPYAPPVPEPAKSERVSLTIRGENLPLDAEFRAALAPGREALARAWDTFAVTGRMNFAAHIDELPNQPQDVDVTVSVGGCRMTPAFFQYPLEEVAATVRYAKSRAWLTDFHGRHGQTVLRIKQATALFPAEGGFWAQIDRLQANPLVLNAELQRALPPVLRNGIQSLQFRRPVGLDVIKLVFKQAPEAGVRPIVYWDGSLLFRDAAFHAGVDWESVTGQASCQGLYNGEQLEDVVGNVFFENATVLGQPLQRVHLPLAVWKNSPDILRLPDMKAQFFGGTLGGEGRIEFGSIFRFEMLLKASHVQLEQFGRHNLSKASGSGSRTANAAVSRGASPPAAAAELSGLAEAGLHLTGEGPDLSGIKGSGRLDVPSGKLYRLPLMLDLLKWLGLRLPDRTAFEQAHAIFTLDGPRVRISQLDLFGNAISVRGQGSVKLDGSDLSLDLNADWGQIARLLPPGLSELSRGLSNQLLKIKVRGKVGDARFEKELVPLVTDPLKRAWNGMFPGKKDSPRTP